MSQRASQRGSSTSASTPQSKERVFVKYRKFRRKRACDSIPPSEIVPKKDFLQRLPLEILAEILAFTSPATVLAVARTCKWLCQTLTHEDRAFIWKVARKHSPVGMVPDPPPGVPEPAYASAIFDPGYCIGECQRSLMQYFTYEAIPMARVVLSSDIDKELLDLLPQSLFRVTKMISIGVLVQEVQLYNMKDLMETLQLWISSKDDPQERGRIIKRLVAQETRNVQRYKHERQYSHWFYLWSRIGTAFANHNISFVRGVATSSGWAFEDLLNAPIVESYMEACRRERGSFNHTWWRLHEQEIKNEVETLARVRIRRAEERDRVQRQKDVNQLWHSLTQLRSQDGYYSVPPFNIFLSLPFIRNLERTSISDVKGRFEDGDTFQALLDREISVWAGSTQKSLAATLGYKRTGGKTKTAEQHIEDLQSFLDRATSLFECSKCRRTGPIHRQWTTMTHRDVIGHRCPKGTTVTNADPVTGEERTKGNRDWNVNNFVPDEVSIAAVRLACRVADPPFDESASWTLVMDSDGGLDSFYRYVCLTCPSRITMTFWEIPGHAKRHKALFEAADKDKASEAGSGMKFELGWVLEEPSTQKGDPMYSKMYPYTEQLMSNTPSGKRKRALQEYGCRHCEFSSTSTSPTPRLFTVDGLQCHLKSK
ncbi:hypothetical protein FRC04_005996 [Tulasnella sp. 424]|nr:hypothetical protein FRC04_005996 [Tulasnella sp. 424]KAG8975586.1 hypothetical protein FRC05_005379 [Tulasnella sp. 425]